MQSPIGNATKAWKKPFADHAIEYRADIDGLRAISILLVLVFHTFPSLMTGAFIGVDIFFVISGFLITKIILIQTAAGVFTLRDFYERRIRRIFPALTVVLVTTYIVGWIVLLPKDLILLGENSLAGIAFVSNLFQMREADYFTPAAALNPLLHLWSLGIEEQFYIFWPFLLIALRGKSSLRFWIIAITGASFCANLALFKDHGTTAFYSPVSRAWELLIGCMLASQQLRHGFALRIPADVKAAIGITLIAIGAFFLTPASPFPGWNALLPVMGAALLLDAPTSRLNRFLLASRPMVSIGLISYPLYLWHWPTLTYLGMVRAGTPTLLESAAGTALATLLAWLTFQYIERPIQEWKLRPLVLSCPLAVMALVALLTTAGSGLEFRFPPEVRALATVKVDDESFRPKCFLAKEQNARSIDRGCVESGQGPLIMLWGDSTAAALYAGLKAQQTDRTFRIAQFTAAGCSPLLGFTTPSRQYCAEINDTVLDLVSDIRPDIVLLQAVWESKDLGLLQETIGNLRKLGVPRIVVIGRVPTWDKRGLPHTALNLFRFHRSLIPERLYPDEASAAVEATMEPIVNREGAEYLSALRAMCAPSGCLTRTGPSGGDLVAADWIHLTRPGSVYLVNSLLDRIFVGSH